VGGAITYAVSAFQEESTINAEELEAAQEKAKEVSEKYRGEILQNMSYITDAYTSSRSINGTNEQQRSEMAAYISSEWFKKRDKELWDQYSSEQISSEEYEAKFKNIGLEWQTTLEGIGENTLATAYKNLDKITENIGTKTYGSVEQAVEDIIKNDMNISESDPLFAAIKQGFLSAAYNGVGGGIDKIVTELEQRKTDNPDDAYAYIKAIDSIKSFTGNEASFMDQVGLLDNVDVFNGIMGEHGNDIREALKYGTSNAAVYTIDALEAYKAEKERILSEVEKITDWTTVDMEELTDKQKSWLKKFKTQQQQ
jgi:hypothetical protein